MLLGYCHRDQGRKLADVFLSYARGDRVAAERLAHAIAEAGLTVWWDRHIKGGAEFSRDIERQLDAASRVRVMWSKEAEKSRWVRDEASVAADSGRLVGVTIDGTPPPLGFRQFQTIDLKQWAAKGAAIAPELADALEVGAPALTQQQPAGSRAHRRRLLAPGSLAASFTPHTANVGYGWFLANANGREIHHANGRSPGFAAQADYYVEDRVSVVALANTYVSVTTHIARAVGALYFGEPVKPMPSLKPDRLKPQQVAALLGKYQFGPDYYVPNALMAVREQGGYLETVVGDYVFPLVQVGPSRFLMRSFWIDADFTIRQNGKATSLVIDGRKGVRVQDDAGN